MKEEKIMPAWETRRLPDDEGFFPITHLHRSDIGNKSLTDEQMINIAHRMQRILLDSGYWHETLEAAMEQLNIQK